MEKNYLLPLGSVVYLREGNKKVLIIARGLVARNGDGFVFFDYGGVTYPEGLQNDQMAYFQHDAVAKVVFEGYRDLDDEATVEKIVSYMKNHPEIPKGDVKELLGEEDSEEEGEENGEDDE